MALADDVVGRPRPGKAAIMRAAVTVMGEHGYEGASVREIASRAGVSVAALYYHFPSKHDLLREYLVEAWQVMLARLDRRLLAAAPDPRSQLDEFVSTLIATQLHDEYAKVASNVALREHTRLAPPERALMKPLHDRLQATIEHIVAAGVGDGTFAPAGSGHEAARAIVILSTSLSRALAAEGRPMAEVIATLQQMAHALVGDVHMADM
jgi:AcrR family transcriptional regulator